MRGIQIKCIEYINNQPVAHHYFPTAADGDNAYRATVSYNAFNKAQAELCMRDNMARRFWPIGPHELASVQRMEDSMTKLGYPPADLPRHYYKDIWTFYKAVGYDYKRKKLGPVKN